VVLGVSADTVEDQAAFKMKNDLPFTLLADTERQVIDVYGVWGERVMGERRWMGIRRTTYVIGPDGRITHLFENVKPQDHGAEVLAAL
jgi:thioredoxin-dependent peroxiredoxin